jgi:hypothetical protein
VVTHLVGDFGSGRWQAALTDCSTSQATIRFRYEKGRPAKLSPTTTFPIELSCIYEAKLGRVVNSGHVNFTTAHQHRYIPYVVGGYD